MPMTPGEHADAMTGIANAAIRELREYIEACIVPAIRETGINVRTLTEWQADEAARKEAEWRARTPPEEVAAHDRMRRAWNELVSEQQKMFEKADG